jgi:protein SCO1/2
LLLGVAAIAAPRLSQSRSAPLTMRVSGSSPTPGDYSSASLFQLEQTWTTDSGQRFRLSELRGTVVVVAMIFTRCPSVCPTLVKELQALDRRLPAQLRAHTRFALLSIDPEHDTPPALAAYRAKMGLDPQRWLLLRGSADDVRDVSASLGVSYGRGEGAAPAHSRRVTVLNAEGEIIHQQAGVVADPEKLTFMIDQAAKRVD